MLVDNIGQFIERISVQIGALNAIGQYLDQRQLNTVILKGLQSDQHPQRAAQKLTDIRQDRFNDPQHKLSCSQYYQFRHHAGRALGVDENDVILMKQGMLQNITQTQATIRGMQHRGWQQFIGIVGHKDIKMSDRRTGNDRVGLTQIHRLHQQFIQPGGRFINQIKNTAGRGLGIIGVNQERLQTGISKKAGQICRMGGFTFATFGGNYRKNYHVVHSVI
ncbi:hypothetical protein Xbud_03834 [Xenorhabdus budapestensis]|uniref:Uncharacterized protein n=1 Tax=Xenorhabdus budapestensis TaxID=290110 RepID=A0A2D0IJM3_XENBU|nr:hypothetical protein Xbud_03834 [Xenorhabdus budapestensis]